MKVKFALATAFGVGVFTTPVVTAQNIVPALFLDDNVAQTVEAAPGDILRLVVDEAGRDDDVITYSDPDLFAICDQSPDSFTLVDPGPAVEDGGSLFIDVVITPGVEPFPGGGAQLLFTTTANDFLKCRNNKKVLVTILTDAPTESPTTSPTFGPTTSPTLSPTANPTTSPSISPTQSPVIGLASGFFWRLPEAVFKFSDRAFLTENERLDIVVLGGEFGHPLLRFPNETAFLNCDFSEADLVEDESETVPITAEIGQKRWYGSNKDNDCEEGLKLEVIGIPRDDEALRITWFRPGSDEERESFQQARFIRKGQVIEFNTLDATHNLVQFRTKRGFDECDASDTRELNDLTQQTGVISIRDPLANDLDDANDILWYGCTLGDHCQAGQKVALRVVADDFVVTEAPTNAPEAPPADDDDDGIDLITIIVAAVAGVAVIAVIALLLSRGRSRSSGYNAYPVNEAPVKEERSDVEVAKTPYSSAFTAESKPVEDPEATPPQNTSVSLARSKAALSGLNF